MDARTTTETLRQHGRFVHELARALLRDSAAAEDVAQEAWVQWWRRAEAPTNPRGWLARVVRSLASNQRRAGERRERREAEGARPELGRAPDEDVAEAELLHRLVDAVYALEEPYQETILARYFRGEEAPALARASGTPLATVRSRERRGLEMLRARLDREPGGRAAWALALAKIVSLEAGARGGLSLAPWLVAAGLGGLGVVGWWTRTAASEREELASLPAALPTTASLDAGAPDAPELPAQHAERAPRAPGARATEEGTVRSVLRGVVLDTAGQRLPGTKLRFLRVGDVVGEATADGSGQFELDGPANFTELDAQLPGYRLLYATDPERDPLDSFEPMRVTLAPVGALDVLVVDGSGAALEGVRVTAQLRREERVDARGTEPSLGQQRAGVSAHTDAAGHALVADVWSGARLELELDLQDGHDNGSATSDRQREGRLVLDGGPGTPLVVGAGRTLALEAVWGVVCEIGGLVLDAADGPVDALVEAEDIGYEPGQPNRRLESERGDARGRFLLTFRPAVLRGPVRVAVTTPSRPIRLGSEHTPAAVFVPALSAERVVSLAELETRRPLVFRLAPLPLASLAGQLLDPRGDPAHERAHQLLALRDGRPLPPERRVTGRTSGGGFVVPALVPGTYELLVASRDARERAQALGEPVFTRFAGLVAGDERLSLRLPDTAPVRLRVRGDELARVNLARFLPTEPAGFPRTLAEPRMRASAPAFWLSHDDCELHDVPEGTWIVAADELRGASELTLALGEPGWYRIGVESASPLAAVATELLWFEPGEHVLDVDAPPASGILRGRWLADGTREFYGLVLTDEQGQPLSLDAPSPGAQPDVIPLPANGAFLLREFPLGRYRLRFGTLDELAAGRFAREVPLEIHPGENALEVRL